jgi:hypothetical protein
VASLKRRRRRSSDRAAQHLAYLVMVQLGQLVTLLPLSLLTPYGSPLHASGLLALALSQSVRSPDLDSVAMVQSLHLMLEGLAGLRYRDPDRPQGLSKATLTRQA